MKRFTTRDEVTEALRTGDISIDEAAAAFDQVRDLQPTGKFKLTVSEKGCVSIYGLRQRFPISLHYAEVQVLNEHWTEVLDFCESNRTEMLRKRDEARTRS